MKTHVITILILSLLVGGSSLAGEQPAKPAGGLHMACLTDNLDVVRQHIDFGSDLNKRDAYGSTPLMIAITFGRADVARALIEAGADIELGDSHGATPLSIAAFFSRTEIVESLLEHGADRYARSEYGGTAYDIAAAPLELDVKTYDSLRKSLGPLGLKLDLERIAAARPAIAAMLRPEPAEFASVIYEPLPADDWQVSTPEEQGLDPQLVAEFYSDAGKLETIYSLLIVKNGRLVAEGYFNGGSADQLALVQSISKSFTSTLIGIALEEGLLTDVDQKVLDFFPEAAAEISDPRKQEITLRQMLQMRAGYPWEETDPVYWDGLWSGDYVPLLEEFPLTKDPGTEFQYSNVTSNWLGLIAARAVKTDLRSYGDEKLFKPLGIEPGDWATDIMGNRLGCGGMHFTARDLARFGQLYLDGGSFGGKQIVPAMWVEDSLEEYSTKVSTSGVYDGRRGRYFHDIGYGYQWWSGRAGPHHFNYAAGHGGQKVILLEGLEMVIVVTADPFYGKERHKESAKDDSAIVNVVGKFISLLPGD